MSKEKDKKNKHMHCDEQQMHCNDANEAQAACNEHTDCNAAQDAKDMIDNNGFGGEAEQGCGEAKEEKVLSAEERIMQLEAELADVKNKMLYKVAEFDNYRKRTLKEKADLILNGGRKVMEALLPVADDLERAEANIEKAQDVDALREGLELVFQKFEKALEGLGLKKMDVIGADFSTDFHEAIAFVPGNEQDKGKVVDCVQNGYLLNEQVIRFAKVAVGQ